MKKTYIPSIPRSRKLRNVGGGTINVSGGSAQSVPVIEGHTHDNKIILDAITQLHLRILSSLNVDEDGALIVELSNIIKELDTTVPTDENLFSALRTVLEIKARSISKTDPDTAQEIIKFVKGIEIGAFTTGPLGAGASLKMENGVSRLEIDQLDVRMRATFRELIIESLKHIGGQLILSPARMKCTSVVDGGTYYRCYFDTGDGKVSNEFVAGDQARCQVFTGSGVKMYWRLVTSVGTDWINLSKTDAISGSSIPEAGDDIVQLGNRSDVTRQNAQILSTVGPDAPSWKQYKGINAFSLEGKDTTVFSGTGNKIDGKTVFMSSGANVEDGINSKNSNYSSQPTSYKANDTWTLSADQTVNGVAYKSGEILTATQDSTTFVQSHWVKKVRYTDDTAVDNLQIGGINILRQSAVFGSLLDYSAGSGNTVQLVTDRPYVESGCYAAQISYPANPTAFFRFNNLFKNPSTDYVLSLVIERYGYSALSYDIYAGTTFVKTISASTSNCNRQVINVKSPSDLSSQNYIEIRPVYTDGGQAFWLYKPQLEKGNKATDWSPAPEDVQAKIDAAKQEALDAAGNAQTSANNANTAVVNLNTYVNGSFKDGIIDSSEAKAIEKYINVVNSEKAGLEATYNKLYLNSYLEGVAKTTLLNSKVTYFGAVDTLLNSINTAISDGKTTIAEKQAVDTNYSSYKTALASLQSAIEEANKAIQTRLDTLSTEKVDNLRIGVRNFFKKTTPLSANWESPPYTNISDRIERTDNGFNYTGVSESQSTVRANHVITGNGEWTVSFEVQSNAAGYSFYVDVCDLGEMEFYTPSAVGEWEKCELTVNVTNYGDGSVYNFVDFSDILYIVFNVRNLMVVQGNKAPESWIEAPDDIQARIDAVNATASDAQAKANISKAVTDTFKTTINGGLISTVMILLRELNSIIETAGISGIQDDGYSPAYWSGGTYAEALAFGELMRAVDRGDNPIASATLNAKMSSIVMLHNGHAKVGELIVKSNGQIIVLDKATGKIKFVINSQDIPSVADLMSGTTFGESKTNPSVSGITDTVTLQNTISVDKNNSTLSFAADISLTLRNYTKIADASMSVDLFKNGVLYLNLGSLSVVKLDESTPPVTDSYSISKIISGIPTGTYSVKITVIASGDVMDYAGSISTSTLAWNFTQSGVRYFQLGLNGLMAFYSDNHFHYTETGGLDVRGATNAPGVLAKGRVLSGAARDANYAWGAKYSTAGVTKISTGGYRVPVSCPDAYYSVFISPRAASRSYYLGTQTSTYFEVYFTNLSGAAVDTEFDFTVVGKNY